MDLDTVLLECEEKMEKAVEHLSNELRGFRTGRATPALVEYVKVDYYGSMTDLRQLATISVPEPTQLLIKPHDPSSVDAIVKAVQGAGLGLNPSREGKTVRINMPPLSGDRRRELAGAVKQTAEHAKIAIRNIRRDANKHIDQLSKDKDAGVTEDDAKSAKDEVQNLIKKYEGQVESATKAKQDEILDV